MTLYRAFAWRDAARADEPDGPLWFPRIFQGEGRHDNPRVYGCLYLSDRPESCIVEQLAAFRGQRLMPGHSCVAAGCRSHSRGSSSTTIES